MTTGQILLVALVHVLFAHVNSAYLSSATLSSTATRQRMRSKQTWEDFREVFTPPTVLLVSSPQERKVSYSQLKNFKAVGNVVLPIYDAGLVAPYGIAWDAPRSALYICDGGQRKIFRVILKAFKCERQCDGIEYQLRAEGNRYTVVEGVISQWASVDAVGNLYFTDQESNSVNKLSVDVIDSIIRDELLPKDLKITSEPELEGGEAAKESVEGIAPEPESQDMHHVPVSTLRDSNGGQEIYKEPSIHRLYEKGVCAHVGTPAGVVATGVQLYWTNQVEGFGAGSLVEGKTNPRIKHHASGDAAKELDGPSFPSSKIVNNTGSAYGMAVTASKIIFSASSKSLYATSRGTGQTVELSHNLMKPRGIVWDGDNTVFVADEEGNHVVSLPVGLLRENAPVTQALDIHSPFGIALISPNDPVWNDFRENHWAGARHIAHISSVLLPLLSLWMLLLS